MQVIGLCRFSYPAIGGFQITHDSIDARIAFLYAQDRLEERFRLFETVTLPGLRDQTDGDFDFLVVIGESLPSPWRDRLYDLTADMPQVQIIAEKPRRMRQIMREVLLRARKDPGRPCLQFRHDDDDAVACTFVEDLRAAARDASGFCAQYPMVAFDWIQGYVAEFSAQGIQAAQQYRPYLGIGFATYVSGGMTRSIMNYGHHKIVRSMPTICFGQTPMWVRTHNDFNDSRQARAKSVALEPLGPEQEAEFKALFSIDADRVREVFST